MSYSWRVSSDRSTGSQGGGGSSNINGTLGSAAVSTPLTPPSVRNVTPATCLSMLQFRALMQEYRSLDDSVNTRLNRTLSNSRTSGYTHSPSILSSHVPSNTSLDLGKSTYSVAPDEACLSFWRELVNVWIGREDVLNYCMQVEERERLQRLQAKSGEEWLLNNDIDKTDRQAQFVGASWQKGRKSKADPFDSRASRSEESGDALQRQLRNEFSVEAIIRKRSLDVFKSRCRFFTPTFAPGAQGEKERAMWEGQATPSGQQARQ